MFFLFQPFKCNECDFASHALKYLKAHKLNCHDKGKQKYKCEKCGDRFPFPSHLKLHQCGNQTIRNRGGPVKCPECDQARFPQIIGSFCIALLSISISQHQQCLALTLLSISINIAQHQHCLALLSSGISIALCQYILALPYLSICLSYYQHCFALALFCISIAQHQYCFALVLALAFLSIALRQYYLRLSCISIIQYWHCLPSFIISIVCVNMIISISYMALALLCVSISISMV